MQLCLNVLVFIPWIPKGKKRKLKGEMRAGPLDPLEVTSAGGGGACNNAGGDKNGCLLSAPLWSEAVIVGQNTDA